MAQKNAQLEACRNLVDTPVVLRWNALLPEYERKELTSVAQKYMHPSTLSRQSVKKIVEIEEEDAATQTPLGRRTS